eukprot:4544217-Amphidinium_carterae.1
MSCLAATAQDAWGAICASRHLSLGQGQRSFIQCCFSVLHQGGRLIVTKPSPHKMPLARKRLYIGTKARALEVNVHIAKGYISCSQDSQL